MEFTSLQNFSTNFKVPVQSCLSQHTSPRSLFGKSIHRSDKRHRLQITAAVKKKSEKHIVCSKTLVAKPDQAERLQKKCQDILDFSLGKAANKSNGIIEFTCSRDIHEPNSFHFWERYDSNVSLGRHNTSAEFMSFMEGVRLCA